MPRKLTAYNLFMQKKMKEIRASNPGMRPKDVMKAAAQVYRTKSGGMTQYPMINHHPMKGMLYTKNPMSYVSGVY